MSDKKQDKLLERRLLIPGRRTCDQYCAMHDSMVTNQQEIKIGFKWLIAMHVSELLAIIAGLAGIIGILITKF